jgi:hypothetical protein
MAPRSASAAVLQNGRDRAQRRRLRPLIREQLADQLEAAREESRLRRNAERPRCGAKTRRGTCCVRSPLANGRCPNHGGLSTGPRNQGRTQAHRRRAAETLGDVAPHGSEPK